MPEREDETGEQAHRAKEQTPEEYLLAVTIGERVPLNGTIYLADYDRQWPQVFAREAEQIRGTLRERVLLLEHVGSTSVPGLAAKPIIDMVLVVADTTDEESYALGLEARGYTLRIREPDWYEHRLFKKGQPAVNLHVFPQGCPEIERRVVFRDWIRSHEEDRQLYERTKKELAAQQWKYTQHYADAKTAVVERILGQAQSGAKEG